MKILIKKLFYILFLKNLKLITNKVIKQTTQIKELSAFIFLKTFVLISKNILTTIDLKNKSRIIRKFINKFYKMCQKFFLLFFINIFTIYIKYEKKIFFFFFFLIIIFSIFILFRHNLTNICPLILNQNLAPNTSQILKYCFTVFQNPFFDHLEEVIIGYIFPCTGILFFGIFLLIHVDFMFLEQYPLDDSFAEICLLFFLQIYTKNFIEDTQEETIEIYANLDDEFDKAWDLHSKIWFSFFFLLSKQFWFVDFHHYWPMLKKRDNSFGEELYFLRTYFKYTEGNLRIRDPNWKLYRWFYPFPNTQEKHYDENWMIDLTNVYNHYIKVIFFKFQPIFMDFEFLILFSFLFIFFFFIISTLLIDLYLNSISTYFMEQMTYTIYRPFLDQYFYNWNRMSLKILQTKNSNFLIKDPYLSQYLDLFYFIPDEDSDHPSLFEHLFNAPLEEIFPTLNEISETTILDENEEEIEEIDEISTITPSRLETVSFIYFILLIILSFIFFELNRQNPIFFSGKTNFINLPKMIPLTDTSIYSWLFQNQQLSPLFFYMDWPGWKLYITKIFFIQGFSNFYNSLVTKKTNVVLKNYWDEIIEKIPPLLKSVTIKQKIKGSFKRKKIYLKKKIIWFGKGLIEFFVRTTILPGFRMKRYKTKPSTIPGSRKKLLFTFKQNRLFLLRKESYKNNFKK